MLSELDDQKLICNMCNMTVCKIVPLYDHDQEHKRMSCCVKCKKKIRHNIPIVKFKRDKNIYSIIERELNEKAKKRIEVKRK